MSDQQYSEEFTNLLSKLRAELFIAHQQNKIPFFNISSREDKKIELLITLKRDFMHKEQELIIYLQKKYGQIIKKIFVEQDVWRFDAD